MQGIPSPQPSPRRTGKGEATSGLRPISTTDEAPFDLVVAADVLYEERNAGPLLALLEATVTPDGEALIADPGRRHAAAFFDGARAAGWSIEVLAAGELPAGGISVLRRDETPGRG